MTAIKHRHVDYFRMTDARHNHATIVVDPETGYVTIGCDDRSIAGSYTWANCQTDCMDIYEFLEKNGHDWHYFLLKFVPGLFHVFSVEKSQKEFRRTILEKRRNKEITRIDALIAWEGVDDCMSIYDFHGLFGFVEPVDCIEYEMSPDVKWFADTFWLPFVEHIKEHREELLNKIEKTT